jgi:hypothetical protein
LRRGCRPPQPPKADGRQRRGRHRCMPGTQVRVLPVVPASAAGRTQHAVCRAAACSGGGSSPTAVGGMRCQACRSGKAVGLGGSKVASVPLAGSARGGPRSQVRSLRKCVTLAAQAPPLAGSARGGARSQGAADAQTSPALASERVAHVLALARRPVGEVEGERVEVQDRRDHALVVLLGRLRRVDVEADRVRVALVVAERGP